MRARISASISSVNRALASSFEILTGSADSDLFSVLCTDVIVSAFVVVERAEWNRDIRQFADQCPAWAGSLNGLCPETRLELRLRSEQLQQRR